MKSLRLSNCPSTIKHSKANLNAPGQRQALSRREIVSKMYQGYLDQNHASNKSLLTASEPKNTINQGQGTRVVRLKKQNRGEERHSSSLVSTLSDVQLLEHRLDSTETNVAVANNSQEYSMQSVPSSRYPRESEQPESTGRGDHKLTLNRYISEIESNVHKGPEKNLVYQFYE